MEVVNKKGVTIHSGWATVSHDKFLKEIVKGFKHIRVGVIGGKKPFTCTYFKVKKKEVIDIVRMNQCKVRFSIMFNSKVQPLLEDVLYINELKASVI